MSIVIFSSVYLCTSSSLWPFGNPLSHKNLEDASSFISNPIDKLHLLPTNSCAFSTSWRQSPLYGYEFSLSLLFIPIKVYFWGPTNNEWFFPTNFVTFVKEKLGTFWIFFVFLVQVLTNFSFKKKSSISQNWKQKEMKENPGQVRSDTTKKRPLHCCAW
jgi:hypothetical protein